VIFSSEDFDLPVLRLITLLVISYFGEKNNRSRMTLFFEGRVVMCFVKLVQWLWNHAQRRRGHGSTRGQHCFSWNEPCKNGRGYPCLKMISSRILAWILLPRASVSSFLFIVVCVHTEKALLNTLLSFFLLHFVHVSIVYFVMFLRIILFLLKRSLSLQASLLFLSQTTTGSRRAYFSTKFPI